jgi:hypothetical protein
MKLAGVDLVKNEKVIVFPRQTGDLVFTVQAVLDYADFDKLCPTPMPPKRLKRGVGEVINIEDPDYKKAIDEWATNKTHWMFLKALEATEGLTWDTVDMAKYETWGNYQQELQEAQLAPAEVSTLVSAISEVCGLDQAKIDAATNSFLAERQRQRDESAQPTAP